MSGSGDVDCVELEMIGTDISDVQEIGNMEAPHVVEQPEYEAVELLNVSVEPEIKSVNPDEEGKVKLESENDLPLTVIVQPSGHEVSLGDDILAGGTAQLVHLESGEAEHSIPLLTDDSNSIISRELVQLYDGTTAVIQRGYQLIQLADGSRAIIPSGFFTDAGMEGAQLSLEPIDEQMEGGEEEEEEEEKGEEGTEHKFSTRVIGDLTSDMIDADMVSGNGCPSADDTETIKHVVVSDGYGVRHVTSQGGVRLAMGKTFKCSFEMCGRLYTTHHHLKVHMRSHTGDRPFRCDFEDCNKAFATGYGLKSHRRIHTGEKPYRCISELCDKAFKTSGDLQKHMRTHTGERPFVCPYKDCNRSFTTSNIRKVHIRTHTGERPYTCDEKGCGKTFASATNYKNHIRIHSGEKPYECSVPGCGKRFTEYSSLYKHHVVHTHTKPYPCGICGKMYRQTSTLAMHKRMAHGDELAEEGDYIGVIVQASDETASEKPPQSATFQLSDECPRGPDEAGDGNLVIDTSDAQQVGLVAGGASSSSAPLQLHQLSSATSVTENRPNNSVCSHVLVIANPSQLKQYSESFSEIGFQAK